MSEVPQEVQDLIATVTPARRRRDAETLLELFMRVTGETPHVWSRIIAFGSYHYRYATGREGDAPAASFAPRKSATVVYLPDGNEAYAEELAGIGPHETGRSCLYLKDLEQNDLAVLEEVVARSYATVTSGTFGQTADGPPPRDPDDPHLARVREICLALPGAAEKASHGSPTFFTRRTFAVFGGSLKGDHYSPVARQALLFLPDESERAALVEDERFFVPAYFGTSGWLGLSFHLVGGVDEVDWDEVAELVEMSYRLTAPASLVRELDDRRS